MRCIDGIHFGWVPDVDIVAVVERYAAILESLKGVLITCIDSGVFSTEADVHRVFRSHLALGTVLDYGFVVAGKDLPALRDAPQDYFCLFAEIWLWEKPEEIVRPPDRVPRAQSAVGESVDSRKLARLRKVAGWMNESRCRLVLADGTGLMYLSPELEWAQRLRLLGEEEAGPLPNP